MDYTEELTDELTISEGLTRSSDTMKISFEDSQTITAGTPEVYKIIRKGDTAFARSEIY